MVRAEWFSYQASIIVVLPAGRQREQNGEKGCCTEESAHRHGRLQGPPFQSPKELEKPKKVSRAKNFCAAEKAGRAAEASSPIAGWRGPEIPDSFPGILAPVSMGKARKLGATQNT
jgi:hypothetical protein